MKCNSCGKENIDSNVFCNNCGKKLESAVEVLEEDTDVNEDLGVEEVKTNNNIIKLCRCGNKIEPGETVCKYCNTPVYDASLETEDENIINKYVYIFWGSVFFDLFFFFCVKKYYLVSNIFKLTALITAVSGKIKYPKNKKIKIMFYFTIGYVILSILLIIWFIILCKKALESCGNMG